jgi:predicted acylesterase/phospholipase RssA
MFQTELGEPISGSDPRRSIYLALSGGGFRATAFHTGVILAYLAHNQHKSLTIVNGVSGGSIAAAHFGNWWNHWHDAAVPKCGVDALRDFASPLFELLRLGVRWQMFMSWAIKWNRSRPFPLDVELWTKLGMIDMLSFYDLKPSALECILDKYLFRGQFLSECFPATLFVFTATDLFTGRPFYITSSGAGVRPHRFFHFPTDSRYARIARGVCASAAFPLFLRPVEWHLREEEADEYRQWIKDDSRFFYTKRPSRLFLTDGGVGDNIGTTFFLQLVYPYGARFGIREKPQTRFVMAYDAGREPSKQKPIRSALKTTRGALKFLDARKEFLNDFAVRLAAREADVYYVMLRYDPGLEEDPSFGSGILKSLMRIRTDLNRFTDTEIYTLAYCGYCTALYGLARAELIHQDAAKDRDLIQRQFSEITHDLLDPLPANQWASHLAPSSSRFWINRTIRRRMFR